MKRNLWAVVGIEGHKYIREPKLEGDRLTVEQQEEHLRKCLIKAAVLYGVFVEDLLSKSRKGNLVYIRQLICYFAVQTYGKNPFNYANQYIDDRTISRRRIGAIIGGRDHTTVIHSVQEFKSRLDTDAPLPNELQFLKRNTVKDYKHTSQILKQLL
jgi:chromosomal replication initiation ATPase DnaA